jgi:hypothetical protein
MYRDAYAAQQLVKPWGSLRGPEAAFDEMHIAVKLPNYLVIQMHSYRSLMDSSLRRGKALKDLGIGFSGLLVATCEGPVSREESWYVAISFFTVALFMMSI